MEKTTEPGYLGLAAAGELARRAAAAHARLAACDMCPRRCGVNRLAGELGVCRTGAQAVVASYGPHFGEEDPLVGRGGSGTIFFSHCSLGCVFCQNYEISHLGAGEAVTAAELAAMMLALQDQGCANINLVTPSHVVAQILAALEIAAEGGLKLPLVYNTSGYDAVDNLALLDGVVDIYMPDFKFWDSASARRFAKAPDYPQRARAALLEMHRQVGDLQLDRRGLARRGLLVRHLVMPGGTAESEAILQFIAGELSPATYVNIMEQYHPCGQAGKYPPLDRPLEPGEYERALAAARRAGLRRLDERIGARLLRRLP